MPSLHPLLGPLAGLVGVWTGQGTGQLPGQPSFVWRESLVIEHVGTPACSFRQRTTRPDGDPFHAEDGWIRVPPELQSDEPEGRRQVELVVTSPTGILEALSGTLQTTAGGFELQATSAMLARTPSAGHVTDTRRRWALDGDELTCEFWMATPTNRDPFHHLSARLHRDA